MSDSLSPEDLSLVERIHTALRLTQELIEHAEKSFVPALEALRVQTKSEFPEGVNPPDDHVVHAHAAKVLESDHQTVVIYDQLKTYCQSIRAALAEPDRKR